MKIYVYNVNNKNEFLKEIEVDSILNWSSTATVIPPQECNIIGKSYAFDKENLSWSILIDDWRGITLYNKNNSTITKKGAVGKLPNNYTNIVPPDFENEYVFQNDEWILRIPQEELIKLQLKEYENEIQNHIDSVAQSRGYDNGYTCASYYDDKNERYANDAKVFKDWRSDVWVYVNELLNSWKAGNLQEIPTIQNVINNLPTIEWIDE